MRSSSFLAVACAKLVLLIILHLVLFFSSSCRQAQVLCILAGKDQIDSYVMVPMVQTAKNCGRRPFLRGAQADAHGPCDHGFPSCSS